jgi:predicted MPP superfamily phosphohydrolase
MAIVLTIFSCVLGAYHWLLIDRLLLAPTWPGQWVEPARVLVIIAGVSLPVAMTGERMLNPRLIRVPLVWPSMLWLGISFMLFTAVVATDVVHALLPLALIEAIVDASPVPLPSFERGRAIVVVAGVLPLAIFGLRRALRPAYRKVEVALTNWPSALDGLRIVQLSDIHIGPILTRRSAEYLTRRANELSPDLIVITGDLVDGDANHLQEEVAPFSELTAPLGRFFVTGNHDFYSGADPWCEVVESLGFEVLRNRHVLVSREGAKFTLAGVDDHRGASVQSGRGGEDLEAALQGTRPELPLILLAHDPATFNEAARRGVDLQISGHTHGGQIWPFRYAVRMTTKWIAGLYREGRSQIYVSRGTGFWGPPLRVGAPSEITELTIRRG